MNKNDGRYLCEVSIQWVNKKFANRDKSRDAARHIKNGYITVGTTAGGRAVAPWNADTFHNIDGKNIDYSGHWNWDKSSDTAKQAYRRATHDRIWTKTGGQVSRQSWINQNKNKAATASRNKKLAIGAAAGIGLGLASYAAYKHYKKKKAEKENNKENKKD